MQADRDIDPWLTIIQKDMREQSSHKIMGIQPPHQWGVAFNRRLKI